MSDQLTALFPDRKSADKPQITADTIANSLCIIAKDADFKVMKPVIEKLDNTPQENPWRVRIIPIPAGSKTAKILEDLKTIYTVRGYNLEVSDTMPGMDESGNPLPPGVTPPGATPKPSGGSPTPSSVSSSWPRLTSRSSAPTR